MTNTDILFFTRGRGRGHAVRDLAIADELLRMDPNLKLSLASYDLGFACLAESAQAVYDLSLPERNGFSATVVRSAELIQRLQPKLVVAQEEPGAILAAHLFHKRAVFSTNWFSRSPKEKDQALEYAHRILFMEDSGLFVVPASLEKRVVFCGPVVRPLRLDHNAAALLRASLGMASGDLLISVLPGSPPEAREPIFDLIVLAFSLLKTTRKRLLWVAGRDYLQLRDRVAGQFDITILEATSDIGALITASQVLVTKGTYNITKEIVALGRPSLSLSHGYNWVDDLYANQSASNLPLRVSETNASGLASRLETMAHQSAGVSLGGQKQTGLGTERVAEAILEALYD